MASKSKRPFHEVILDKMEEIIPQIASVPSAGGRLRDFGSILKESNLEPLGEVELSLIVVEINSMINRLDSLDTKMSKKYLQGLIEKITQTPKSKTKKKTGDRSNSTGVKA